MKWMYALILCLMCLGCGDTGFKEMTAAKPGSDAWIIGKWRFNVVEGGDASNAEPATTQFWANHSCRRFVPLPNGGIRNKDAAWQISGDSLVIIAISGDSEAGPDIEKVKEVLTDYSANPEGTRRVDIAKMTNIAQDSFTLSFGSSSDTMKIQCTRIKN